MIKMRGEFKPRQSAPKPESDWPPQLSFSPTWFNSKQTSSRGPELALLSRSRAYLQHRSASRGRWNDDSWKLGLYMEVAEVWGYERHGQSLLKAAAVTKSQHTTKIWPFPVSSLSTRWVVCPPSCHKYLLSYVYISECHSNNLQLSNLKHLFFLAPTSGHTFYGITPVLRVCFPFG